MVAFVLHYARVKSLDRSLDDVSKFVLTAIVNAVVTRNPAPQSGDRQAPFPPVFQLKVDNQLLIACRFISAVVG